MRRTFLEFLASEGAITRTTMETVLANLRTAPAPIGSIALSYGMITCDDIDEILDEQRQNHAPFGEIAIRRGLLTRTRLEALLRIQQIRAATDMAEALSLSGICPVAEAMEKLGAFLIQSARTTLSCPALEGGMVDAL